jgi:hypothetical protein
MVENSLISSPFEMSNVIYGETSYWKTINRGEVSAESSVFNIYSTFVGKGSGIKN